MRSSSSGLSPRKSSSQHRVVLDARNRPQPRRGNPPRMPSRVREPCQWPQSACLRSASMISNLARPLADCEVDFRGPPEPTGSCPKMSPSLALFLRQDRHQFSSTGRHLSGVHQSRTSAPLKKIWPLISPPTRRRFQHLGLDQRMKT